MSNSMNPTRRALLNEARSLGIVGRHKMNNGTLRQKISERVSMVGGGRVIVGRVDGFPDSGVSVQPGTLVGDILAPLEALRAAIQDVNIDQWKYGTVVRWEKIFGTKDYLFAAIKTPAGWATTAQTYSEMLTYDELVERLAESNTQNVQVATAWDIVG